MHHEPLVEPKPCANWRNAEFDAVAAIEKLEDLHMS